MQTFLLFWRRYPNCYFEWKENNMKKCLVSFLLLACTTLYYFRFTSLWFSAIFCCCCNDKNFPDDLPTPAAPHAHVVGSYIVLPLSYRWYYYLFQIPKKIWLNASSELITPKLSSRPFASSFKYSFMICLNYPDGVDSLQRRAKIQSNNNFM